MPDIAERFSKLKKEEWEIHPEFLSETVTDLSHQGGTEVYQISGKNFQLRFSKIDNIAHFGGVFDGYLIEGSFDGNRFITGNFNGTVLDADFLNGPHPDTRAALGKMLQKIRTMVRNFS